MTGDQHKETMPLFDSLGGKYYSLSGILQKY